MKKIKCVIMDWAGTAVDYGCFAPVAAFIEAFAEKGLIIDVVQTRKPMGLPKIQHIRELLSMPEVNEQFAKRYQRAWTEEDVVELNRLFEKHLFASLENYTDPIPGVIPTLEKLRAEGLKIGSTTGYTREMMNVVLPAAQAKGYRVDYCATPNLLPAGRPAPYMIFENLIKLGVDSLDAVVKVGDTIADIKEGVNAKVCVDSLFDVGNRERESTQRFAVWELFSEVTKWLSPRPKQRPCRLPNLKFASLM